MMALRQSLLPVLVMLMVAGIPVVASAGDRQHDNDRGGKRHHLIDHKALKAKIEALREKIKELKERKRNHQGGSDGSLTALQAQVTELQSKVDGLTSSVDSLLALLHNGPNSLLARVEALEANGGGGGIIPANLAALSEYLTVDKTNTINGVVGPHVIFGGPGKGVNVHIRNGLDPTVGPAGTPNGLGNLIVGYNEGPNPNEACCGAVRTGSHNIVGGSLNAFTASGGLVLGTQNWINSPYATILGGERNQAHGLSSSILGGMLKWTSSTDETVPPIP